MKARSIELTEIYPKFAKLFIPIAGPKNIQHNTRGVRMSEKAKCG